MGLAELWFVSHAGYDPRIWCCPRCGIGRRYASVRRLDRAAPWRRHRCPRGGPKRVKPLPMRPLTMAELERLQRYFGRRWGIPA